MNLGIVPVVLDDLQIAIIHLIAQGHSLRRARRPRAGLTRLERIGQRRDGAGEGSEDAGAGHGVLGGGGAGDEDFAACVACCRVDEFALFVDGGAFGAGPEYPDFLGVGIFGAGVDAGEGSVGGDDAGAALFHCAELVHPCLEGEGVGGSRSGGGSGRGGGYEGVGFGFRIADGDDWVGVGGWTATTRAVAMAVVLLLAFVGIVAIVGVFVDITAVVVGGRRRHLG